MNILASLVLAATLVAPIPFATVDDIGSKNPSMQAESVDQCGRGSVVQAFAFDDGKKKYNLFIVAEFINTPNQKVTFILMDAADGNDTPVWIGVISGDGKLQVQERLTYTELQAKYPKLCDVVKPKV